MLKQCTKRKEQLPLLLERSETDSAWEGSSIRRRNWDEHFILSHESHTHVKLGKKGIKGRRSLIERIYSISKQHWMLCLYNMDCMGTQGEKQPGIKYCLCVYPRHLLKPCTVIHGPQSNSISSESRSNITIPVKHQAHTRKPLSALTKWEYFVRHSTVMVHASVLLPKGMVIKQKAGKEFIYISVCNLELRGSSTLIRNTMEEIILTKVMGNFSPWRVTDNNEWVTGKCYFL